VESFLKESKQGGKRKKELPEDHFSRIITDKYRLKIYETLILKGGLTLV
jgi:hypothetical protein